MTARRSLKHLFSITIAAMIASCALMSSCTFVTSRPSDRLVTSLYGDPPALNPITTLEETSSIVMSDIYESMLEIDRDTFEYKPKLAKRWEASPDHLNYTFWLRDDVKWHDGAPFTVDDVLYTFERIRDPKVDAPSLRHYFKDIVAIDRIGTDGVRFTLAKPYFRSLLVIGGVSIIPKHAFDNGEDFNAHSRNRHPIGTGPFEFVEWRSGKSIKLQRFDGYWGKRQAISGVDYKIIPDNAVAFQLLKKGALDLGSKFTVVQWMREMTSEAFSDLFNRYQYYTANGSFICWNTRKPMFADSRVRTALTMLIDRESIRNKALFGKGEIIESMFYKFGPSYNKSLTPYPFAPEEAAKLLDEAGWIDSDRDGIRDLDGTPFKFRMLCASGSRFCRQIGLIIQESFAKNGIKLDIDQLEWATMLKKVSERNFDSVQLALSLGIDQDPFQLLHSSQSDKGSNYAGIQNERIDTLIEAGRTEFDSKKRNEMYSEIQRIIYDEQPYSFLYTLPSFLAVSKRFDNVVVHTLGVDSGEWTIKPWQTLMEW